MTTQGIRLATQPGLQRMIAPLLTRLDETQQLVDQVQQQVSEIDLSPYVQSDELHQMFEALLSDLQGIIQQLQQAVSSKASSSDVSSAISQLNRLLEGKANQVDLTNLVNNFASHTHAISDIQGLATALQNKAESTHTHSQYLAINDFNAWRSSAIELNNFSCTGTFAHKTLNGGKVGFFGATPSGKPSITGSRQGNPAIGSLLRALANLGLVTDNTVG